MHIVIAGALPDPEVAADLVPHLAKSAPTLAGWLGGGRPNITNSRASETWCTPLEHWLLQARGFLPAQGEHISAGLGPLRADSTADEPVWLAELIHMAPSRDGAALLPADSLSITMEQSEALLASAKDLIEDTGIGLDPESPSTWRVQWPSPVSLPCASPALVAISSVNDWWPQEDIARPWRRLVNSLQMAWYEHPVNQGRAREGLPPINSLWLYGGARSSQLSRPLPEDLRIETALLPLAAAQDWGRWIDALGELEQQCFAPLSGTSPTLTLTGRDRYVTLAARQGWLARLRKQHWENWWRQR